MKKRGFTLVEVLVVFGLIAIVTAVLLPAIQHARQDQRRVMCKNNLKQLGLALHNYHDTYNTFAPGWVSAEGEGGLGARTGWQTSILPYVDQAPLYNLINFHQPPQEANATPKKIFQTVLRVYRCPNDPTPELNPLRGNYAVSNYVGNYGHLAPSRLRPLGMSDSWPGAVVAPMKSSGIFARNSSVRIRDITDGTSNTLLAGEKGFTSGAGIWVGVTSNSHEDDTLFDASHRSRINKSWSAISSRHAGGAHFLMCDGAVRFVSENIDSKPAAGPESGTYQRLAYKNDGLVIGEF